MAWANWFGGVYITERNFFSAVRDRARASYLDMYPEFVLPADERKAFLATAQGAIVGRKLAEKYGWKVGDQIPLRGTIYPGHLDVHAARHLRRRRRRTDDVDSSSSTGTT